MLKSEERFPTSQTPFGMTNQSFGKLSSQALTTNSSESVLPGKEATMSELSRVVKNALASEYRERAAELHKWADPLDEEQFWMNPYEYGNSVGHLVLHLTGNLSYYIGAQIAGTGYVRHRMKRLQWWRRRLKNRMKRIGRCRIPGNENRKRRIDSRYFCGARYIFIVTWDRLVIWVGS